MWISKAHHAEIVDRFIAAEHASALAVVERDALRLRLVALDTTMDWFRVRITQLEHERALMLQNYLGVTVPALSIEKTPSPTSVRPSYDAVPHFDDMGDTEAKKHGITWNPETGEVSYPETN